MSKYRKLSSNQIKLQLQGKFVMATMSRKSTRFRMFSYKKGRIAPALSKEYRSGPEVFGDRAHYRLDRNKKPRVKLLWHPVSVLLKTGQKQRKQGQGKQVRLLL